MPELPSDTLSNPMARNGIPPIPLYTLCTKGVNGALMDDGMGTMQGTSSKAAVSAGAFHVPTSLSFESPGTTARRVRGYQYARPNDVSKSLCALVTFTIHFLESVHTVAHLLDGSLLVVDDCTS